MIVTFDLDGGRHRIGDLDGHRQSRPAWSVPRFHSMRWRPCRNLCRRRSWSSPTCIRQPPRGLNITQNSTRTASGPITLTGTTFGGRANAGHWAVTGGTCTCALAASSSCTYAVTFTPKHRRRADSGSLSIGVVEDPNGGPSAVTLTGTGLTPVKALPSAELLSALHRVGSFISGQRRSRCTTTAAADQFRRAITSPGPNRVRLTCQGRRPRGNAGGRRCALHLPAEVHARASSARRARRSASARSADARASQRSLGLT